MGTRILAALLLAALGSWSAEAGEPPRHRKDGEGLSRLLGLSPQQTEAVAQENALMAATRERLVSALRAARGEVEQAGAASDENGLAAALLAQWKLERELERELSTSHERTMAVLTPAQIDRLRLAREVLELSHLDPGFLAEAGFDAPRHFREGLLLREEHPREIGRLRHERPDEGERPEHEEAPERH